MLDEIGLFDEDFFSYLEDVDLAWRGQANGWRCLYVPSARVYHVHSGSGLEGAPLKSYLLGRNKWWTIAKNYPWPELGRNSAVILAYDLMALIYTLVAGRSSHGLRGRLAALRGLGAALGKRRATQRCAGYSPRSAYDCLTPVESPLSVWRRYRHLTQ
jgi:GT2 family glycosyltransferase